MMRGVRVNPANLGSYGVGAGCRTGDVDHATHAFGLAIPFGVVSTTGVAGLTLSGGHGYLSRQYGLAIDNLVEADVVLADGTFVIANGTDNPDLFWDCVRRWKFCAATSFLFEAHPASTVYAGPIFWELKDAASIMRWYQDFQASTPDEFYVFLGLQTISSAYPSPRSIGAKDLRAPSRTMGRQQTPRRPSTPSARPFPIRSWILRARSLTPHCKPCSTGSIRKALQWYWKGDFVKDAARRCDRRSYRACCESYRPMPLFNASLSDRWSWFTAKAADETAWNCRDATWSMAIVSVVPGS